MASPPSKRTSQRLGMAQAATQREREQRDRLAALYAARGQEQSAQSETSNLGDAALPRRISQRLATHTPASSPGRSSTAAAAAAAAASPAAAAASSGTGTSPAPADFSAAPTSAEKRTSKRAKVIPASASPASASSPSARAASGLSSAATASATDSTEAAVSGTSPAPMALLTTGTTRDGGPQEETAAPVVAEHQAPRRLCSATRQGGAGHDGPGRAAKEGGGKSR